MFSHIKTSKENKEKKLPINFNIAEMAKSLADRQNAKLQEKLEAMQHKI